MFLNCNMKCQYLLTLHGTSLLLLPQPVAPARFNHVTLSCGEPRASAASPYTVSSHHRGMFLRLLCLTCSISFPQAPPASVVGELSHTNFSRPHIDH